jgi:hypothetical protein
VLCAAPKLVLFSFSGTTFRFEFVFGSNEGVKDAIYLAEQPAKIVAALASSCMYRVRTAGVSLRLRGGELSDPSK